MMESHWTQFAATPETKGGLSSLLRNLTVKVDQFAAGRRYIVNEETHSSRLR